MARTLQFRFDLFTVYLHVFYVNSIAQHAFIKLIVVMIWFLMIFAVSFPTKYNKNHCLHYCLVLQYSKRMNSSAETWDVKLVPKAHFV